MFPCRALTNRSGPNTYREQRGRCVMVRPLPSKQKTRVRFPPPAPAPSFLSVRAVHGGHVFWTNDFNGLTAVVYPLARLRSPCHAPTECHLPVVSSTRDDGVLPMTRQNDQRPEGLAADLPHLTRRRVLVTGLAMGGAALSLWAARGRAATVTGTAADGSICVVNPAETGGPFPADGTNVRAGQTVNILTEAGRDPRGHPHQHRRADPGGRRRSGDAGDHARRREPRLRALGRDGGLRLAMRRGRGLFDLRRRRPQLPAGRRDQRRSGTCTVHHSLSRPAIRAAGRISTSRSSPAPRWRSRARARF